MAVLGVVVDLVSYDLVVLASSIGYSKFILNGEHCKDIMWSNICRKSGVRGRVDFGVE
jgi:hypothetical protein